MKAMYIGTFDPITLGHLDIIGRASKLFSSLIVVVGRNSRKANFLDGEERVKLLQKTLESAELGHVKVVSESGLAVDIAARHKVDVLVRGMRSEADFRHEIEMSQSNKVMAPKLETVFIPADQALTHISSSLVREIAINGGDISSFVPNGVAEEVAQKFAKL